MSDNKKRKHYAYGKGQRQPKKEEKRVTVRIEHEVIGGEHNIYLWDENGVFPDFRKLVPKGETKEFWLVPKEDK